MMSRARTLSPGSQGEWFFRDRGRRAAPRPQPSGKTDETAAVIGFSEVMTTSKLGVGTTVTARFPAERIVYGATKAANTTSLKSAG